MVSKDFVLDAFFENVLSPKDWPKNLPPKPTDFRDESNGTSLGPWKLVKTIKSIGLASLNTYMYHKVLLHLLCQQYAKHLLSICLMPGNILEPVPHRSMCYSRCGLRLCLAHLGGKRNKCLRSCEIFV